LHIILGVRCQITLVLLRCFLVLSHIILWVLVLGPTAKALGRRKKLILVIRGGLCVDGLSIPIGDALLFKLGK
jgi:hypothetical protein